MRDPNPVVILVPGVGRFTFAADKTTARLAGEFYGNAINVMRGAEAHRRLRRPARAAKPSTSSTGRWRRPSCSACRKPKPLVGKIALVTGAAGGIGGGDRQRACSPKAPA